MISSVRSLLYDREPNNAPTTGIRSNKGTPDRAEVVLSWIWPPMAMVSPSCTVTWVEIDLVAKEGEAILLPDVAEVVASGSLMFWLIINVTMPLGVTRAVIVSPIPVLVLETPVVTDPVIPLAVELDSEGTVVPTLMEAGILSVAMMEGEEMTLALLSDSIKLTTPCSARLLPTSMEADRPTPPPVSPAINEAAVLEIAEIPVPVDPDVVDPGVASACNDAVTSLENP